MPRKAKPFIDKKSSETFVVVHRSQLDPKYYDDEASKFVLMSTKAVGFAEGSRHSSAGSVRGGDGASVFSGMSRRTGRARLPGIADRGYGSATSVVSGRSRVLSVVGSSRGIHEISEVDEEGFPLDGYDYSKHMAAMGGGTYVSAAGSILAAGVALTHGLASKLNLPDDVLPSRPEDELDRMLEAINLKPSSMPPDLRAVMEAVEEADEEDEEDLDVAGLLAGDGAEGDEEEGEWGFDDDEEEEGEGEEGQDADGDADAADKEPNGHEEPRPRRSAAAATARARAAAAAARATGGAGLSSSSGEPGDDADPSSAASAAPAVAHVVSAGGELDDDFVLRASGEVSYEPTLGSGEGEEGEYELARAPATRELPADFNFDAHVARLMAKAEGKWVASEELDELDEEEEDGEEEEEEDEEEDDAARAGAVGAGGAGAASLEAVLLNRLMAQYDDEEIGELDDEDPRLRTTGFQTAPRPLTEEELEQLEQEEEEEEEGEGEEDDFDASAPPRQSSRPRGPAHRDSASVGGASSVYSSSLTAGAAAAAAAASSAAMERALAGAVDEYLVDRDQMRKEYLLQRGTYVLSRERQRDRKARSQAAAAERARAEAEGCAVAAEESATAAPSSSAAVSSLAGALAGVSLAASPAPAPAAGPSDSPAVASTAAAAAVRGGDEAPSAPAPAPRPTPSTSAFTVKIGLLKKQPQAPQQGSAPEAQPSSTASSAAAEVQQPVLSAQPVVAPALDAPASSAAAALQPTAAAAAATAAIGPLPLEATSTDPHAPPSNSLVPFGFAEGDFDDRAPAYAPDQWEPAAPRATWDAETVISTYTNTENHPRTLGDGVSLTSARTGHRARVIRDAAAGAEGAGISSAASEAGSVGGNSRGAVLVHSYGPTVIRLSKKTGLPMGPGRPQQQRGEEEPGAGDAGAARRRRRGGLGAVQEEDGEEGTGALGAGSDGSSGESGSEGEDSEEGELALPSSIPRPANETAEERRARKGAVKLERRARREDKKALKTAYKAEELRQEGLAAKTRGALTKGRVLL